jgi:exodeoxyribonuclease VII large subunit
VRRAAEAVAGAERHGHTARTRLAVNARHLVDRQHERLAARAAAMARRAPHVIDDAHAAMVTGSARVAALAVGHVARAEDRAASWRRLLGAYDVERQLERGYTLTLAADGKVVRSVAAAGPGTVLVTRFSDGTARSLVDAVVPADGVELGRTPGEED